MKESVINIQLLKVPMFDSCKWQENSNSGSFSNKEKSIKIITVLLLDITFGNYPNLISLNRSIGMILNYVYPFTTNWCSTYREIHNGSGLVILKRSDFRIHGLLPTIVFGCLDIGFWFNNGWNRATKRFLGWRTIGIRKRVGYGVMRRAWSIFGCIVVGREKNVTMTILKKPRGMLISHGFSGGWYQLCDGYILGENEVKTSWYREFHDVC